jgi:succinate-acetate transporter protein
MNFHAKDCAQVQLVVNIIPKENKSTKHILLHWIVFTFNLLVFCSIILKLEPSNIFMSLF